ncbi:hypothetical protein LINPERPRIM_LOCUS19208 [Linum perenne]
MGDEDTLAVSNRTLEERSNGLHEALEAITDEDGNWHVGAMATLVDVVGLFAVYSLVGHFKATVDFSFSLFSTAKALEEVELEGKVVGEKERLASVEVRKTSNRELIALGKQWMSAHSKSLHSSSKL